MTKRSPDYRARQAVPPPGPATAGGGRLTIDQRARRVLVDGAEVILAPREYELLAYLSTEPGRLFTHEEIMEAVWDSNWFGPTKTLDVHVGALRRKLGEVIAAGSPGDAG
ncbi:MAG TPA: winged helix-turn-helix domain-containing protein [Actinoplanes sp.]|nr:winged helix-turn-helix domain-containing protein [Actinoplanes sp.]